jgi:hypothetical protein
MSNFADIPTLTEISIVKVWKSGLKPIIVTTIYNHPKTSPLRFTQLLQQVHAFLCKYDGENVIFGDFNIDLVKHKEIFNVNTHKYLLLNMEFGF